MHTGCFRFRFSTLGALLVVATNLSCESGTDRDSALRISIISEPSTLDPSRAEDTTASYLIPNLWEGLTRFDGELEVEAGVAEMWSFSTDLKTITFTLRDDAVWSDGAAVVANDFVYSWRRLLDPATRSPHAQVLFAIINAEEVNSGALPPHSLGVEAPHERTLVVRFDEPVLDFPRVAALAPTVPLRADIVEGWSEPESLTFNGAYQITDWRPGYRISLTANPDYFRGPARIETVQFFVLPDGATALALYDRGDVDIVLDLLAAAVPHYGTCQGYRNPDGVDTRNLQHLIGERVSGPTLNRLGVVYLEQLQWAE